MTLAYGWVIKTQKRISNALLMSKLTKWEMQFVQTIDTKLETYKTDARLGDNQQQRLMSILARVENHGGNPDYQTRPSQSSPELADLPFGFNYDVSIGD